MLASQIPPKFAIPFGNSAAVGTIRPIPQASQTATSPGAASLTDGFPVATGQPLAAGGIPPSMQDFNGLFNQITAWARWQGAGALVPFDGAFSSAVNGYPSGAILSSAVKAGRIWISTVDNNTTNPDSGPTPAWLALMLASDVIVPATAAITLYVDSTTGNDTTGVGTTSAPFRTNAKAISYAASRYSFAGYGLIIQQGTAGTYDLPATITGVPLLTILGNLSNPTAYSLVGAGTSNAQSVVQGCNCAIQGAALQNTNPNLPTLAAVAGGQLNLYNVVLTGTATLNQPHLLSGQGGYIGLTGTITVQQSAAAILDAEFGAITSLATIVVPSAGTFSGAVVVCNGGNIGFGSGSSFSGTTNGKRYSAALNGVINTFGSGPNFISGSIAGTVVTGGQYA